MNEKQYFWIYGEIKKLIRAIEGRRITEEISEMVFSAIDEILRVTERSRAENKAIDKEIRDILQLLVVVVHSCEATGNSM